MPRGKRVTREMFEAVHKLHDMCPDMSYEDLAKHATNNEIGVCSIVRILKASTWEEYEAQRKERVQRSKIRVRQQKNDVEQLALVSSDEAAPDEAVPEEATPEEVTPEECWFHDEESEHFEISFVQDNDITKLLRKLLICPEYTDKNGVKRSGETIASKIGWINTSVNKLKDGVLYYFPDLEKNMLSYFSKSLNIQAQTNELLAKLLACWTSDPEKENEK